ncbi:MAG: glucose-1-phosphate cytidylyltransferase [Solirubrobacteraceae bacterium]
MKAVILAGGRGTRLAEETSTRPKPMVEVGGKPILWHIMKQLSTHDVDEFIICLGYLGYVIKEWFANYTLHTSDVTFDMRSGEMEIHKSTTEPWKVTLVETGEDTMTGGRLKRVLPYVGDEEDFVFTYGDGVADVDVTKLVAFHREQGRKATVTAVQPTGRFGALGLEPGEDHIRTFKEKPRGDGSWINGGYFVLHPSVGEYIAGDPMPWEEEPLRRLAEEGQISAYRHEGFWQAMDTLRDRLTLEELWESGSPPWRTWP